MTTIRCATCNADPGGRWKQPPAMIFIDDHQSDGGSKYRCREHLSPKKAGQIQQREQERGWPDGWLR